MSATASHGDSAGPAIGVTGVENSKVGMWLFLASEVMMFSGLIGSYLALRSANPEMLTEAASLNKNLGALNTFILITSSVSMVLAVSASKRGEQGRMRMFLLGTILLGFVFLGIKSVEYADKFQHGHYPSTNLFFAFYFIMTGLHALHVITGLVVLIGIYLLSFRGRYTATHNDTVDSAGLYWHFVDIVWIFLFPLLYLV